MDILGQENLSPDYHIPPKDKKMEPIVLFRGKKSEELLWYSFKNLLDSGANYVAGKGNWLFGPIIIDPYFWM